MLIENLPALQQWLTTVLKPLCDADPEALTKYVSALLKKDTPEEELRRTMQEQLDIFLQGETVSFVTRLFDCIQTREYENPEQETTSGLLTETTSSVEDNQPSSATPEKVESPVPAEASSSERLQSPKEPESPDAKDLPKSESEAPIVRDCRESNSNDSSQSSSSSDESSEDDRDKTKTENSGTEKRRHWTDKRSRSSSTELSPRRKRNTGGTFSKNASKSDGSRDRHRWSPIKRRIRRDIQRRRRSRSPIPLRSQPTSQNTKVPKRGSISDRSRSRSGSPFRRKRTSRGRSKSGRYPNPPSPEGNTCNSLLDNLTNKCSVKSVVVRPGSSGAKGASATLDARVRCSDFDEKGLCLRGELCPYDHGTDPVVLQEVYQNESGGVGVCAPPNFTGKLPTDKPLNFLNTIVPPVRPPTAMNDEYYPESPSIVPPPPQPMPPFTWGVPRRQLRPRHLGMEQPFMGRGGMMRPPLVPHLGPHSMAQHGQRQLISVPVDGIQRRGVHQGMLVPENPFAVAGARMVCRALFGMRGGRGRGTFDYSRLGVRPQKYNGNCCLEVRKIPREMNKIESLISHFSRFGQVVTIQIGFDNDPEGALVVFGSHSDALNAFRSTSAVLNNRFIRVYWHNNNDSGPKNQDVPMSGSSDGNMEPSSSGDNNSVLPPPPTFIRVQDDRSSLDFTSDEVSNNVYKKQDEFSSKSQTTTSAPVASPSIVIQTEPPVTTTPKKNNSSTFTASEVQRKQEMMSLLNAQIQEQKQLITKLEVDRSRMTQKQRDEVLQIIKSLQTSCEELKVNIAGVSGSSSGSQLVPTTTTITTEPANSKGKLRSNCSLDEIRRQLLDAELALYMREREGQETVDLEKKILQLRAEEIRFSFRK